MQDEIKIKDKRMLSREMLVNAHKSMNKMNWQWVLVLLAKQ